MNIILIILGIISFLTGCGIQKQFNEEVHTLKCDSYYTYCVSQGDTPAQCKEWVDRVYYCSL